MTPAPESFAAYLASLSQLALPSDPLVNTRQTEEIRRVASDLTGLPTVSPHVLAEYVRNNPEAVPVLGLAVGFGRERLKNVLKHRLGTASWATLARTRADDLIAMFDAEYQVIRLIEEQRARIYSFGDILVARAGTRVTATAAGATGRRVEDTIEAVAASLGIPYETRTRFTGRNNATASCDLAIPSGGTGARIVVAAKGFDSTGSKLSDAVREIEDMANVRLPVQFVMAVVDGIGWKSRVSDLRRIYDLRDSDQIDGLYTLESLPEFRSDLLDAARRLNLI